MGFTAMITPAYVRTMAAYNTEMNRSMYAAADMLTDEQRGDDRGLFWKSIHGTLSHILWGDLQWMSRLAAWSRPSGTGRGSAPFVRDFAELRRMRAETDAGIATWGEGMDDAWLAGEDVWFTRMTEGVM